MLASDRYLANDINASCSLVRHELLDKQWIESKSPQSLGDRCCRYGVLVGGVDEEGNSYASGEPSDPWLQSCRKKYTEDVGVEGRAGRVGEV